MIRWEAAPSGRITATQEILPTRPPALGQLAETTALASPRSDCASAKDCASVSAGDGRMGRLDVHYSQSSGRLFRHIAKTSIAVYFFIMIKRFSKEVIFGLRALYRYGLSITSIIDVEKTAAWRESGCTGSRQLFFYNDKEI